MFKDLAAAVNNQQEQKEVAAMRKDIPVPTEIILRERMCSAIMIEYAATLLEEGKKYDEVRQTIMAEAGKAANGKEIPSTFLVKIITDLNTFFSERESRKAKISKRFFSHKDTQKALTKFSDPNIAKEATMLTSGMEQLAAPLSEISKTTADVYMQEMVEYLKKNTTIPYDFFMK